LPTSSRSKSINVRRNKSRSADLGILISKRRLCRILSRMISKTSTATMMNYSDESAKCNLVWTKMQLICVKELKKGKTRLRIATRMKV